MPVKNTSERLLLALSLILSLVSLALLLYSFANNPVPDSAAMVAGDAAIITQPEQLQNSLPDYEEPAEVEPPAVPVVPVLPAVPVVKSMRLKIPAINVDAALTGVGLTADGAMDVPKNPSGLVWYNLGPRPGENGSAVIAGHYGVWKDGQLGVFNNLHKLQPGDKLYIDDGKGGTATFVVRESRKYDPDADASAVFSSSDGLAHLNLVTCEGEWNSTTKSYSQRLVVFADRE